MEKNVTKILIANDHFLFRKGVISMFEKYAPHFQIVGEAKSYDEIFMLLPQLEVDILLTDDAMPERKLLILLPVIKELYPGLKIIVNSMTCVTNEESIKIINLVDGWISFLAIESDFIEAIETVYRGNRINNIKPIINYK